MRKGEVKDLKTYSESEKIRCLEKYKITPEQYATYEQQLKKLKFTQRQIEHMVIGEGARTRINAVVKFHLLALLPESDVANDLVNGFTQLQITRMAFYSGFANTVKFWQAPNETYGVSNLAVLFNIKHWTSDEIQFIALRRGAISFFRKLFETQLQLEGFGYTPKKIFITLNRNYGDNSLDSLKYYHPILSTLGFSREQIFSLNIKKWGPVYLSLLKNCHEKLKTRHYKNENLFDVLMSRHDGISKFLFLYNYHDLLFLSHSDEIKKNILLDISEETGMPGLKQLLNNTTIPEDFVPASLVSLIETDSPNCSYLSRVIKNKIIRKIESTQIQISRPKKPTVQPILQLDEERSEQAHAESASESRSSPSEHETISAREDSFSKPKPEKRKRSIADDEQDAVWCDPIPKEPPLLHIHQNAEPAVGLGSQAPWLPQIFPLRSMPLQPQLSPLPMGVSFGPNLFFPPLQQAVPLQPLQPYFPLQPWFNDSQRPYFWNPIPPYQFGLPVPQFPVLSDNQANIAYFNQNRAREPDRVSEFVGLGHNHFSFFNQLAPASNQPDLGAQRIRHVLPFDLSLGVGLAPK